MLQYKYEDAPHNRIPRECIDLAALCYQVMVTYTQAHGMENIMKSPIGKDVERIAKIIREKRKGEYESE